MPHNRFYINSALDLESEVTLDPTETRHLAQVMRVRPGDTIELVNGQGRLASGTVKNTRKQGAMVHILSVREEAPSLFPVVLAQAIPRSNRLDTIVEKGTELGMTELWLFPGERSEKKKTSEAQLSRIHKMCVAALKQCGRLHLPEVKLLAAINSWSPLNLPAFYGDLRPDCPHFQKAWESQRPKDGVLFAVGPEAGFTDQEELQLQTLGATGVCLHPNILRTDTASLMALSLIQHWKLHETAS